jgi:hypothetical protein
MLSDADSAAIDEGLALANAAGRRYRPHMQAYQPVDEVGSA